MGPLRRYYLSMAGLVLIGLFVLGMGPGRGQAVGIVIVLALSAYMVFIRCPRCRTRLSGMGDSPGIHGLPGRRCPKCGTNLGRTPGGGERGDAKYS